MLRIRQRLLAPDFWVRAFTVLAGVGMATAIVGFATRWPFLIRLGAWLCAPLIVAGILILLVVFPVLIIANRKQRRQ